MCRKNSSAFLILLLSLLVFTEVHEISSVCIPTNSQEYTGEESYSISDQSIVFEAQIQRLFPGIPENRLLSTIIQHRTKEDVSFRLEKTITLKKYSDIGKDETFSMPLKDDYWVSSGYGMRYHPVYKKWRFHNGIDLAACKGTRVYSVKRGIVVFAGYRKGYGKTVIVKHGNNLVSLYGHCCDTLAKPGKIVEKGQLISLVGNTGIALGNHLHFELRKSGVPVNPETIIDFRKLLAGK